MDAATVVQMCSGWRDVGGHLERVAGALTVLGSALVLTWSRLVLHGILHAQARRTQGASCIQMELARMEVLANSRWALATVCACHGAQCDRQQVPNAIRQQRTYVSKGSRSRRDSVGFGAGWECGCWFECWPKWCLVSVGLLCECALGGLWLNRQFRRLRLGACWREHARFRCASGAG